MVSEVTRLFPPDWPPNDRRGFRTVEQLPEFFHNASKSAGHGYGRLICWWEVLG